MSGTKDEEEGLEAACWPGEKYSTTGPVVIVVKNLVTSIVLMHVKMVIVHTIND